MIRHLDPFATLATAILLLLVTAAPLPFASVLPFERALLQIGACLALVLAVGGTGALPRIERARAPALALAAIGLYGLLQSLPWPRSLAKILAPAMVAIYDQAREVLAGGPGEPASVALSGIPMTLAPAVSRATAIHFLALAAALAAAAAIGGHRKSRRLIAIGLLGATLFEIVYGADRWFKALDTIWGLQVPGDVGRLRGTFVNPDHLALFLAMILAVLFAGLWWALRRLRYEKRLEYQLLYVTLPLMAFVMVFVALSFTGSRAGLLAGVLALGVQTGLLIRQRSSRRWLLLGAAAIAVGFFAIALFGLRAGLGRFFDTSAYDLAWSARLRTYGNVIDLWQRFPWTGSGLGTFREAFPLVQRADLQGIWTHAHSDFLELLATTGLVGLPLVGYGLFRLVQRLLVVLRTGRRSEDRAAGLAALGALTVAAVAASVDFGLTMPANAVTLAVICGLASGARAATQRSRSSRSKPGAPSARTPSSNGKDSGGEDQRDRAGLGR